MRAEVRRRAGGHLAVSFRVSGAMDEILWPAKSTSGHGPWSRADRLWEHSCFEIFARPSGETPYVEVNLAPVDRWAAYAFSDYRTDMRNADNVALITGNWRIRERQAELHAMLGGPAAYGRDTLHIALSALIEHRNGTKSYWALKHPSDKPDFHHPDCFVLELPAPDVA